MPPLGDASKTILHLIFPRRSFSPHVVADKILQTNILYFSLIPLAPSLRGLTSVLRGLSAKRHLVVVACGGYGTSLLQCNVSETDRTYSSSGGVQICDRVLYGTRRRILVILWSLQPSVSFVVWVCFQ